MDNLINKQALEKLAALAKIEIEEGDKEKIIIDLEKILDHFKELQSVDIKNIKPLNGGTDLINITRSDESKIIDRETSNDDLTGQFPENENGFLKIPPVF